MIFIGCNGNIELYNPIHVYDEGCESECPEQTVCMDEDSEDYQNIFPGDSCWDYCDLCSEVYQ